MYFLVSDEEEDEEKKISQCWGILSIYSILIIVNIIYFIYEILIVPVCLGGSNLGIPYDI